MFPRPVIRLGIFVIVFFSFAIVLASPLHSQPGQPVLDQQATPPVIVEPLSAGEDFETQSLDLTAWEVEPDWNFVEDESGVIYCGTGHSWAVRHQPVLGDGRVQYRLKFTENNSTVHLTYRMGEEGRYIIYLSRLESTLHKHYFGVGFENDLAQATHQFKKEEWHTIAIEGMGDHLAFYLDDVLQWEYTDPEPLLAGGYGFENLEATTCVDDIEVFGFLAAPDIVPAMQTNGQPAYMAGSWVYLGGPAGGIGYDIRMSRQNPDVMIVSDAMSGIYKSTDGGATWLPTNNGIQERFGGTSDLIAVFSATIDPNNPDIMWAGLQNFGAVYRSVDGGATWERRGKWQHNEGFSVRGIAVEPDNSDVVYVTGELEWWAWSSTPQLGREFGKSKGIVYKTTDGGQTWREIWQGDNLTRYVLIDPHNVNTLYLSTGFFDREAANSDVASNTPGGVGVLKSTDGGATWTVISDGLRNLYIGSLVMHPTNANILLAGAGNNAWRPGGGVYLTTDGGTTWRYKIGTHVTAVEFAPSDPNIAYAAGPDQFFVSTDAGQTWIPRDRPGSFGWGLPGTVSHFPIDLEIDPRDPQRIFINSYGGGNVISEDGGFSWEDASKGYTGAQVRTIVVDPNNAGRVLINGRQGPFLSVDGGETWRGINTNNKELAHIAEGLMIALDPANPHHILTSSAVHANLYASSNDGINWQSRFSYFDQILALPGRQIVQGVHRLVFAPSNPDRIYAGWAWLPCYMALQSCDQTTYKRFMVSNNGGMTWAEIADPKNISFTITADTANVRAEANKEAAILGQMQRGTSFVATKVEGEWIQFEFNGQPAWVFAPLTESSSGSLPQFSVGALAVHPQDENQLWVSILAHGLFYSSDGGTTWQKQSVDQKLQNIHALVIDPTNPQILYAGTLDYGVFKSVDGGVTWQRFSRGMDANESVHGLAIDPLRPDILYAMTSTSGVYVTTDGGQNWSKLNDGLTVRSGTAIAISADGSVIYVGTEGGGVFRMGVLQ